MTGSRGCAVSPTPLASSPLGAAGWEEGGDSHQLAAGSPSRPQLCAGELGPSTAWSLGAAALVLAWASDPSASEPELQLPRGSFLGNFGALA